MERQTKEAFWLSIVVIDSWQSETIRSIFIIFCVMSSVTVTPLSPHFNSLAPTEYTCRLPMIYWSIGARHLSSPVTICICYVKRLVN